MKITAPGTFVDMLTEDYFADPCPSPSLTQSIAKVLIERSPAHARLEHPRLASPVAADEPPEKYVVAQAIGNAAHKLMIGRGKDIAVIERDSFRSDKAKIERDEAETAGKCVILTKHFGRAVDMVKAARRQLEAAGCSEAFLLGHGAGEVVIAWQEGDLWFRSMIDWVSSTSPLYFDFKTSGMSVAPHAIPPMMVNAGWDIQAAMQERGLDILDPSSAGRRKFRFVAQENEPPYALTVCELPEAVLTMGRKKLQFAVDIWTRCMASGEWPAYPTDILYPEYPGYLEAKWLDREVREHDAPPARRRAPMLTSLAGG